MSEKVDNTFERFLEMGRSFTNPEKSRWPIRNWVYIEIYFAKIEYIAELKTNFVILCFKLIKKILD